MPQFGSYSLLLALALSVYSFAVGAFVLLRPHTPYAERLAQTARRAGMGVFIALTCGMLALIASCFQNDFSVAYIFHHSNKDLAAPYKFSVLWSGQEGSLLFWAWLLSTYGFVMRLRHQVDTHLVAYASVIVAAVQIFFTSIINFAANPFAMMVGDIPPDGNGLNPLLQYPEMVIHPPMLYLGYVGFSIPFAFALGALIMKYPGEKWIHITRRWTMVTWGFLTCGIFLGAHWAYSVLGWGGYWGWDPVENASLLPWLTGTAFLHSVMMQEKRGMLKMWNMWLIFSTFLLAILGTSLTRSGVVSSVHAFAESSIGWWFLIFICLILATCLTAFVANYKYLKSENRLESLVSRESSFLFNNLVLLASCFAVLWGTLFPVISEFVQGTKVTVGPPFFNRVNIPIALFLLFLTAVGPLLAWRSTSFESVKRNFTIPAAISVASAIALVGLGWKPWESVPQFYSMMAIALSVLVFATVASEFYRGARVIAGKSGQNLLAAMVQLTSRNTRRYGGYIVHVGVVIIVVGFAGQAFNTDTEKELAQGESMQIGGYSLVLDSYTQDDNPNYGSESAIIQVTRGGQKIDTLYPERRFYKASQQTATIVANRSTLKEDLYLVYTGRSERDRPIIKAHLNPLVMWVWIGVWVILFGTALALVPNRAALALKQPARARAAAAEVGD